MIDLFAATTIAFGLGTIGFAALAIERGKTMRTEKARGDFYRGLAVSKDEDIAQRDRKIEELASDLIVADNRLFPLVEAEAKRQAQRVAASKAAAAKRHARSLAEAKERPERAAKTIAALASTPMRSRAQVVAPVKAKRTKSKNAGAGAAATTGG